MEPTEGVAYNKGYWDGARKFAEFITRRDYPNALDNVIKIHVDSLMKKFQQNFDYN